MRIVLLICLTLVGCRSDSVPTLATPPIPVPTAVVERIEADGKDAISQIEFSEHEHDFYFMRD